MKRAFDIFFSAFGLAVLFPVFIFVAAKIKIDGPGSVFFRQTRVGRHGKLFKIIKFRTMISDVSNSGPKITIGNDHRITNVGHWLRKYKLDELPQLLNVIFGDMSLVGPRPEVPQYVDLYSEDVRKIVLSVRPGITDRASINFRDESRLLGQSSNPFETYVSEILPKKLSYNLDYVKNHSLVQDLVIVIDTIKVLIR